LLSRTPANRDIETVRAISPTLKGANLLSRDSLAKKMTQLFIETEQTKPPSSAGLTTPKIESTSIALLFLLSVGCYLNTLMNAFVYDDELQILQNPYIKSWHYLPAILRTTVWSFIGSVGDTNYYRPLMTLTYLGLWKTFGDSPVGYHLFNILVNALVVTCVYFAGRELFKNHWTAFISAILFAVHPVHTETVNWIAAVPDLEATLLCLLGFYAYVKGPKVDWKRQALVVICFFLALLAKEPALMLAPLLVYYEHFVREGRTETTFAAKVKRYLPVCLAGAGYILLRIVLLGKLAPVLQHAQITWPQAIYSGFALITQYGRLLFWPAKLSAFHVFHASDSFGEPSVLMGAAIVVISGVLALLLHKRWPAAAFCIVWTGITLAPVLNARWMAANVLTERYLYLPSVGFCWLAGWAAKGLWDFLGEKTQGRTPFRVTAAAMGIALVFLGAAKTWARNRIWHDDMTLYTATLQTDPDSYVMHMNLGVAYFGVNFKASEKELRRALELKPDSPNVLNALGCVYLEQDRLEAAETTFQNAIAIKPGWTDPHFNYGRLLKKMGQNDKALAEFRKAVEVGPLNATARFYLAQELAERGGDQEAAAEYRQSIQLSPSLTSERNLADILLRTGKDNEAADILHQIAKAYPFDSATHLRLGRLLEKQGKTGEARREYQAALVTDPANGEAQEGLTRIERVEKE
jgi:protein O-mannosyl-transferase